MATECSPPPPLPQSWLVLVPTTLGVCCAELMSALRPPLSLCPPFLGTKPMEELIDIAS